jgi:hypothetical protein
VLCCAGNDLSKWTIKRWWFNGQFYATINDLISSWNADNKGVRSSFKLLKPGAETCQHSSSHPGPYSRFMPSRARLPACSGT